MFGLLAAVRALRTEEDDGPDGARAGRAWSAAAHGVPVGAAAIAARHRDPVARGVRRALVAGLPAGGSAYLALATVSVVPVCVGVGAVASQLAPTRRMALELGGAVVGLFLLLRVIADTSPAPAGCAGLTPLGWAEELRPFSRRRIRSCCCSRSPRAALLLAAAARIAARRDIGTGVLPARDSAAAASAAAVLPDRAGAAQRARQPDRVARQRRRVRATSSA